MQPTITEKGKDLEIKRVVNEILTILENTKTESVEIPSTDGDNFTLLYIPTSVIALVKENYSYYLELTNE